MSTRPNVECQGKMIIEMNEGGDYLVMYPDGNVVLGGDRRNSEKLARRWFKRHAAKSAINVGVIEWREP